MATKWRLSAAVFGMAWGLLGACACLKVEQPVHFSCKDPVYFSEIPHADCTSDACRLAWTYGSGNAPFFPDYRVGKKGKLVFSLGVTKTTGAAAGRRQEMKIEGSENILALQNEGAAWLEPDGTLVDLKVTR